ncbi:efflux RND transporter permease subunit, partial [Staphylococcus aureus]|nr:efflux RND transporter permease subunit [Staphylococcus aureus]
MTQGFGHSPTNIYRANGKPALALGISFAPNVNVVNVGNAIKARLAQLEGERPSGMHINVFYDQS